MKLRKYVVSAIITILVLVEEGSAAQNEMCSIPAEKVCPTIVENQIAVVELKSGIDDVVRSLTTQLKKTHEEITDLNNLLISNETAEAAQEREIEACRAQVSDGSNQIKNLTMEMDQKAQEKKAKDIQMARMRQEVEDLKQTRDLRKKKIDCLRKEMVTNTGVLESLVVVSHKAMDCADHQLKGSTANGVYTIHPYGNETSVDVQCDFTTDDGGWTVFFSRGNHEPPLDFNHIWKDYKNEFGEAAKEYWLGLDFLHQLTSYGPTAFRVNVGNYTDFERFAEWTNFKVSDEEDKYKLTVSGFQESSTMGDFFDYTNGSYFTTADADNDHKRRSNCAVGARYMNVSPGPWWYKACSLIRPTSTFGNTGTWTTAAVGVWDPDNTKSFTNIKTISMKIRRHDYGKLSQIKIGL